MRQSVRRLLSAASLLVAGVMPLHSETLKQAAAAPTASSVAGDAEIRRDREDREDKAQVDHYMVELTAALAVATLALVAVTGGLWRATARLVNDARENAERQLRSYLFAEVVTDGDIIYTAGGQALSWLAVRITNHGTTPAVLTLIRAKNTVEAKPPSELAEQDDQPFAAGIAVGPKGTHDIMVPMKLGTMEWQEMEHGDRTLYCHGVVEYRDILGAQRATGFCWQLVLKGMKRTVTISTGTPLNFRT